MHRRFLLHIVCAFMALFFVFVPKEVIAFSFHVENGTLHAVAVEDSRVGEIWAHANTRPGDTVWNHCVSVLRSYGTYTVSDVFECIDDVAHVNTTTTRHLNLLYPGEDIVLPLSRTQQELFLGTVPVVDALEEELAAVRREVTALDTRVKREDAALRNSIDALQAKNDDQDAKLTQIASKVDLLTTAVAEAEQTRVIVPVDSSTGTKETAAGNVEGHSALPEWVFWTIMGVYALLVVGILILVLLWLTERRKKEAALQYGRFTEAKLKSTELDFSRKPYVFDDTEYWVELSKVTKEGRFFATPYAEEVKEHNLKSHFAHATREKTHLKKVA